MALDCIKQQIITNVTILTAGGLVIFTIEILLKTASLGQANLAIKCKMQDQLRALRQEPLGNYNHHAPLRLLMIPSIRVAKCLHRIPDNNRLKTLLSHTFRICIYLLRTDMFLLSFSSKLLNSPDIISGQSI